MIFIWLMSFAVIMSLGQILLKKAVVVAGDNFYFEVLNSWMLVAIILYISSTLLWVWILKQIPLSTAYPFAALAFVIVPISSFFVFNEPISMRYLVGCGMIIGGVILTAS